MLLQRSARRESSAQARHSSQTGGDVNAIVFHSQHKPKTGSRKLLNDFHTANWWLNIDYLESEITDDRECLQALLRSKRRASA